MALLSVTITAAVGTRDGQGAVANKPEDLETIADLFDRIPVLKGGTAGLPQPWPLDRTGLIAQVASRITLFQRNNDLPIDGVVEPHSATLKLLNQLAGDQLIVPLSGDPPWEPWDTRGFPQLSHNRVPEIAWDLTFGGLDSARAMRTRAYACDPALGTPHIGIGWPAAISRPSAYLIFFHHGIGQEAADYGSADVRFSKGIGDYMIGRLKCLDQIACSWKDVCVVIPEPTWGGVGVFDRNEALITEVLREIDTDLTGLRPSSLPPLLVASYSNSLRLLDTFMTNCPTLRQQVRAVYDFDGLYVRNLSHITLSAWAKGGAKVSRYVGNASPPLLSKRERKLWYVARCMNRSPKVIPLPKSRWVNHPLFGEYQTNAGWAAAWWLHFVIPSCMLRHGLATTEGI